MECKAKIGIAFGLGLGLGAAISTLLLLRPGWASDDSPRCDSDSTNQAPVLGRNSEAKQGPLAVRPEQRSSGATSVAREEALEDIEALHAELEQLKAQSEILAELAVNPGQVKAYDFTRSELEALARNCDVRVDAPAVLSAENIEAMGLREDEIEAYEKAFATYKSRMVARQRELVVAAGGSGDDFDALDEFERFLFVHETLGKNREIEGEVRRAIAEEKAGLREPPTDADLLRQSPHARFYRYALTQGDDFAAALAEELGPDRVHELRAANAGWPGTANRFTGCG